MTRRVDGIECSVAQGLRDEAREYVGEFFPRAQVDIQMQPVDGHVQVTGRILGDPTPHDPAEIVDCLGQLGVYDVRLVPHLGQARPEAML